MRHLSRFFHFHDGIPSHRAVKMLGCLVGAIMLATTATAVTAIQAMDTHTSVRDLHLIGGCPMVDASMSAPRIDITESQADVTWYTTDDTSADELEYTVADSEPTRVPATNGREHHANITDLIPGATYTFRFSSQTAMNDAAVQSGSCTFDVPGIDRSTPEIIRAAIQDIGTTTAIIAFSTTEPTHGWIRVDVATTSPGTWRSTSNEAMNDPLLTTHAVTLTDLVPGQTYMGAAFAQDDAGNAATIDLPSFTTLSEHIADTALPAINDFECRITPNGLLVTFSVPELEVFGRIAYDPDTGNVKEAIRADNTIEAAPTKNVLRNITTFARTLTDLKPNVPYTIIAIATDAAGNATRSPVISCITTGP